MQRNICRLVGACGLIFTFTTAAQTAGGGAAGGASGGTASAGTATVGASGGARIGGAATTTTAPATTPSSRAVAPGSAVQGQSVSTIPGQNVSVVPPTAGTQGQPGAAAPATSGTTISSPNTAGISPSSAAGAATAGAITTPTAGATTTTATRSMVTFNSLPANVQATIASQIPAGAQLGGIIAETTPLGTTFRAQIMQNGIVSEMALNGLPSNTTGLAATTTTVGATTTGTLPGATTTGTLPIGSAGFVVGTPYAFNQLPAGVQTAFAAQGASGVTNVSYTPAGNGGIFRAMVDGKPVEVRVAANGQVVPNLTNRAIAANTTTNALQLDDLPMAVRDEIRRTAPYASVTSIHKSNTASGDVFDITMRDKDDRLSLMQISENGTILKQNQEIAAAITADTKLFITNEPPKLAWNSLPVAVRDSIEAQTRPDTVKMVALTNYLGKTAYVVDYVDRDALRNRLFLNKEGLVVDTQTNIFGIAMNGKPVVIDDLPAPARAAVEQQSEHSAVTRIDLAMYGLTPVYVVTYQHDGEARQMVVARDGRRIPSSVGAPAAAVTGSEKGRDETETKAAEPK